MLDLILSLIRSAREPLTTAELIHELTVLRRTCRPEIEAVTPEAVRGCLDSLLESGRVDEGPVGVWHCKRIKTQGTMF